MFINYLHTKPNFAPEFLIAISMTLVGSRFGSTRNVLKGLDGSDTIGIVIHFAIMSSHASINF